MFDWNGNGREDWGDRYIDYQIFHDIYNEEEDQAPGNGEGVGCGCLSPILMVILVFIIWIVLTG